MATLDGSCGESGGTRSGCSNRVGYRNLELVPGDPRSNISVISGVSFQSKFSSSPKCNDEHGYFGSYRNTKYVSTVKAEEDGFKKHLKSPFNTSCVRNGASRKRTCSSNSTLSLHIEAYESSNAMAALNIDEKFDTSLKLCSAKTLVDVKKLFLSASISSPLEFPRQASDGGKTPEVANFQAGQKLLSPNSPSVSTDLTQASDNVSQVSGLTSCQISGGSESVRQSSTSRGSGNDDRRIEKESRGGVKSSDAAPIFDIDKSNKTLMKLLTRIKGGIHMPTRIRKLSLLLQKTCYSSFGEYCVSKFQSDISEYKCRIIDSDLQTLLEDLFTKQSDPTVNDAQRQFESLSISHAAGTTPYCVSGTYSALESLSSHHAATINTAESNTLDENINLPPSASSILVLDVTPPSLNDDFSRTSSTQLASNSTQKSSGVERLDSSHRPRHIKEIPKRLLPKDATLRSVDSLPFENDRSLMLSSSGRCTTITEREFLVMERENPSLKADTDFAQNVLLTEHDKMLYLMIRVEEFMVRRKKLHEALTVYKQNLDENEPAENQYIVSFVQQLQTLLLPGENYSDLEEEHRSTLTMEVPITVFRRRLYNLILETQINFLSLNEALSIIYLYKNPQLPLPELPQELPYSIDVEVFLQISHSPILRSYKTKFEEYMGILKKVYAHVIKLNAERDILGRKLIKLKPNADIVSGLYFVVHQDFVQIKFSDQINYEYQEAEEPVDLRDLMELAEDAKALKRTSEMIRDFLAQLSDPARLRKLDDGINSKFPRIDFEGLMK